MTPASKIGIGVLAGAVAAIAAVAAITDRAALAEPSGDTESASPSVVAPPVPRGFLLRYDFRRNRRGATDLKRAGLLIFHAHRPATRFVCLGEKRFANFKRRLRAVRRLPRDDHLIRGRPHLARVQSARMRGGPVIWGRKRYDAELPRPAKRLITRLTRLRHELRPGAERLKGRRASSKRLCDR